MLNAYAEAQLLTNARQKYIPVEGDSITIDTSSIVPGSLYLLDNGVIADTNAYSIDLASSLLIWKDRSLLMSDTVLVVYRVFPVLFSRKYAFRTPDEKKIGGDDSKNIYIYSPEERSQELFRIEGLNKSGSISRGITVGNNQDAVVNSSLNLQLSGRLSNNIDVAAAITDDNIPVQPEGNTQQLQEFDKVYIQLSNDRNKLIAGDFELTKPHGYFMNFYKKGQGALYSNRSRLGKSQQSPELLSTVSGAVSKGKFARNTFNGAESNQGPYRLTGAENEMFIIILSGSERIYIDGQLLLRGQSHDYVIDYNTAEITFTPRRLITKDSRIVAEFQYSDKNYARTLLFGNVQFNHKNRKAWVNLYSEQDSRNQPLQQDLEDEQKRLLADAGDNIYTAFSPNVDSVPFNINEILYAKRDTTVGVDIYSIYVWSASPDSAFYRLGFSLVGINNGNYILTSTAANGRVYAWVAPVNGIPQGNYEPVLLLSTPKKRQMVSAGFSISKDKINDFTVELSGSNDDINTFSTLDKGNDKGWAALASYRHSLPVFRKRSKIPWTLTAVSRYEFTYRNFKPVENYRAVEFTRDWNTAGLNDTSDEHNASVGIALHQSPLQSLSYTVKTYNRLDTYSGLMHVWNSQNIYKRFSLKADASYLVTDGTSVNSKFLRHREDLSYDWGRFITGTMFEEERNEFQSAIEDSLSPASFAFRSGNVYIKTADTAKVKAMLNYNRRYDELPYAGDLVESTVADNITGSIAMNINKSNRISAGATYRKLEISDTLVTSQQPDESLLSRIEHQLSVAKGFITATTFYEVGSGQEQKKEFSYIAVAAGTGNYSWNDYNSDGIPQLNEFETPQFQDQANYIRIFTPTADYVKVFTNQLNLVLNLQPGAFNRDNLWSKFSLLSAWRFDNKITGTNPEEALNPFITSIEEQSLITTNASSRNTLFINKTGRVWGSDITYNDQLNKQLLSNGIESRSSRSIQSNTRVNFSTSFTNQAEFEYEIKKNTSEAFSLRNFSLDIYKAGEKISYQPGTSYRISLLYNIRQKQNTVGDIGEKSLTQLGGVEFRYSSVKRGLFTAAFNLVHIDFNQEENTPLAYEMLEGLKAGVNYTWNASIQRNISSALQLSFNYEGRKSEDVRIIHTGGVQARAFF